MNRPTCQLLVLSSVFALAVSAGCQTSSADQQESGGILTLDDFVAANPGMVGNGVKRDAAPVEGQVAPSTAGESEPRSIEDGAAPQDEPEVLPDPAGEGGNAPAPPGRIVRVEPGEPVVVGGIVGQINGRPVYTNEFFEPIDAQLRALAEQLSPIQFRQRMNSLITERLWQIIENELILAEAESRLTPDQQKGLFAWLLQREESIVSELGGSATVATRRLQEEEGVDLQSAVAEQRNAALIRMVVEQEVMPRVIVSWRDVERAYQRAYEQFNPPGELQLARIWFNPETQADSIEEVKNRLEAGEDFLQVAEDVGMINRGLMSTEDEPYRLGAEGVDGPIPGLNELYQEKIRGREEGDVIGPFEQKLPSGSIRVVWLHIVDIERPEGRSIYDPEVQLFLRRTLRDQQIQLETGKYFQELLVEGIYDDLEKMGQRLQEIGTRRYQQ